MKTILKIDLPIEPTLTIDVPLYAEFLKVGMFNEKPYIWFLGDVGQKTVKRSFRFVADGKEFPQHLNITNYRGSIEVKAEVGKAVIHVFEQ